MRSAFSCALLALPLLLTAVAAGANEDSEYEVFYCVYQDDDCLETPKSMPATEAAKIFARVAEGRKNFIGLADAEDVVLQFYVDGPDEIWVEIPSPEKKGSFGKHMKATKASELIRGLSGRLAVYKERLKLEFRAW